MGSDKISLIRATRDGESEVWVPGVDVLQQMTFLPDGDLVVSSGETGSLMRVTPDGGMSLLAADVFAYSVLLGPDGHIYSGSTLGETTPTVKRTNIETGVVEVFTSLDDGVGARSLDFNRDFSKLYIGVGGGFGTGAVFELELDEDLEPVGDPEVLATGVGAGWLDGIAVDACGRLYVPDSWTLSLYRVSPQGEVERYADWRTSEPNYGHAVVFGTGRDGWREDALYLPRPYDATRVNELVIGVPPRTWEGRALNRP